MGANDELPAGWLAAICHNGDASAESAEYMVNAERGRGGMCFKFLSPRVQG